MDNLDLITTQKKNLQINLNQQNLDPKCLKLLLKLIDSLKIKGEKEVWDLFLLQERLIFTSSFLLEKGVKQEELGYDFSEEIVNFIQKLNLKVMEGQEKMPFQEKIKQISRGIDMLLYEPVFKNIQPYSQTLELRVQCFSNLSSIYKMSKKFQDAIKAIQAAISMEEILVGEGNLEAMKNIATNYISKSVILSEIGQHLDSITELKKAIEAMEKYQELQSGPNGDKDEAEQMKYLSVIAYFNLAVEHEHMYYNSYAQQFYQTALNLSRELGYSEMIRTIEAALKKMDNQIKNKAKLKQLDLR